jgi:hypothetical protein
LVVFKNDVKECECVVCDEKYTKQDYFRKIREVEDDEPYDKICSSCQQETRIKYVFTEGVTLYCCLNCFKEELIHLEFEKSFKQFTWEGIFTMRKHKYTVDEFYQIQVDKQIDQLRQTYLGKE